LLTLTLIIALLIDQLLGEPRRFHPLVGFGRCVQWLELFLRSTPLLNRHEQPPARLQTQVRGVVAVMLILLTLTLLIYWCEALLGTSLPLRVLVSGVLVYFCIAPRSLSEHAMAILEPLQRADIDAARSALAMIVSRDTSQLQPADVASATCESLLENGSDGIFAAIFWFCVGGLYGVVIYRAVNTLDAMWGYKNERYRDFGWAAARLDDVLNFIPARLVAFSYALMGQFSPAMASWQQQGHTWKSPNAGPVMAAGAGSLGIILGGRAVYNGVEDDRPQLGCGNIVQAADIKRCLQLIYRCLFLWLVVIAVVEVFGG
jgi:adenosylcobinamide-phosphate synthase